ncbi:MAG TPA: DNA-binding protein [Candidatus Aenigmarchaeota archaeon]|nr:DNA-binding protein [Candidatus Aenigmarchaeota archaeon]
MKALIDTNMLLVPHQFGVDVFEFLRDYELFTLSSCRAELRKLSHKRGDDGKAAKIGLMLLKENKIPVVRVKEQGDKAILNYAIQERCSVATNDIALIKALKNSNIKIIRLKQKKYLEEY